MALLPRLRTRFLALCVYLLCLEIVNGMVTGRWIPGGGSKDLWFFSALGYWCYGLLASPFFVRPADSFAGGLAAALLLGTLDLADTGVASHTLNTFRWVAFWLAATTMIIACVAILLQNSRPDPSAIAARLSQVAFSTSDRLARAEVLFGPPLLLGLIGFYADSPSQLLWLLLFSTVAMYLKPVELLFQSFGVIRRGAFAPYGTRVGEILRVDSPNLIRITLAANERWAPNEVYQGRLSNGQVCNVLALFTQVQGDALVGTGLLISEVKAPEEGRLERGSIYRPTDKIDPAPLISQLAGADEADLIGFVVEDSTINQVRFEVALPSYLEEGGLVYCRVGGHNVYYQVLGARTTEESFQRNPRGTHVVSAAQLGTLADAVAFAKYGWLPDMNAPVFRPPAAVRDQRPLAAGEFRLGTIPGSQVQVLVNLEDLIAFHTAILGVTGTGKTELALDIIGHAVRGGAKVFCVDFTGEYLARLADLEPEKLSLDEDQVVELAEKLFSVDTGEYGAKVEKKALRTFIETVRPEIEKRVAEFLEPNESKLGVFELPELSNTKASLRATELYLSAIFAWARKHRRARRILVVLEEAHTIVPESTWSGFDADTQWVVGRIAQIALQGRKYGVGLLIISQRTALVSKTLLSQCNTNFTFSLTDETSLKYLSNVYGTEHVTAIPNLKFRHLIAFGKAVRSERPVLVEITEDPAKREASERLNAQPEPPAAPEPPLGHPAGA